MGTKTQFNHLQRCKSQVTSIFNQAIRNHQTHGQILNRLHLRLYDTNSYKRLTQGRRAKIHGMMDGYYSAINTMIDWRIKCPINGWCGRDHKGGYPANFNWQEATNYEKAHFWTGTEKQYNKGL